MCLRWGGGGQRSMVKDHSLITFFVVGTLSLYECTISV